MTLEEFRAQIRAKNAERRCYSKLWAVYQMGWLNPATISTTRKEADAHRKRYIDHMYSLNDHPDHQANGYRRIARRQWAASTQVARVYVTAAPSHSEPESP